MTTTTKNILHIKSSILGEHSVSSQLTDELLTAMQVEGSNLHIVERDFDKQPVPHFDSAWLGAVSTPEGQRSAEQQEKAAFTDRLVAEVLDADIIVIGLPMYNFSVPSMLKAWVDHIARAGVTFTYTEQGPVGLLAGKKAYLVASLGGDHDTDGADFLRPYMKLIMGFVGITDVEIISAGGLNINPERKEQSVAEARATIAEISRKFKQSVKLKSKLEIYEAA